LQVCSNITLLLLVHDVSHATCTFVRLIKIVFIVSCSIITWMFLTLLYMACLFVFLYYWQHLEVDQSLCVIVNKYQPYHSALRSLRTQGQNTTQPDNDGLRPICFRAPARARGCVCVDFIILSVSAL
jgi:hypothetical protein